MNINKHIIALLAVLTSAPTLSQQAGKDLYAKTCSVCHAAGIAGAPRYGNAADWGPRLGGGSARLYASALKGTPKGMPPKGGNLAASDADVKSAVDYMLAAVKDAKSPAAGRPGAKEAAVTSASANPSRAGAKDDARSVGQEVAKPVQQQETAGAPATTSGVSTAEINTFNRLLKPVGKRNLPPPEDGIHDPANDGTHALQPPLAAYASLPKSFAGNRVNWVQAIESKKIRPRWDRTDVKAEALVMDMNIVREVKGSMPDVVYPHKQHTQWLDCSNCHPAIFIPQKGANSISMAAILLGEKCGVCHGKVAFPVSECRLCHSKKKEPKPTQATAVAK